MREVVTVQVGEFANFVGSHFWNFQDELIGLAAAPLGDAVFKNQHLNMDVLYRSGETQQGVLTYTPRLVSVGFKGGLGSVSARGTLYNDDADTPSNIVTWRGNVATQHSESCKKNLFLQSLSEEEQENVVSGRGEIEDKDIVECLEKDVTFWTDFSKVHYHPQSLYQLNGLWMDVQEFDNYGIGKESLSWSSQGEEIDERLRFFVEECDHIQGFQFIVDDSGGFSAIAGDFLESVADEYSNTPVLLYSVRSPSSSNMLRENKKQIVSRNLHDAVSFARLSSFCQLYVPVGLPSLSRSKATTHLCIDDQKPYHCSAVYAAALHSIGLPLRMEAHGATTDSNYVSGAVHINDLVRMLAGQGRQNMVAILDVAMPAPSVFGKHLGQSFLENLQPLTPEVTEDAEDLQALEYMAVHGVFGSGGDRASVSEVKDEICAAYEGETVKPMHCHLSTAQCPLPIPLPFPSIFGNLISQHGQLLTTPISGALSRGSLDVHSIPIAARLRSSSAILPFLERRLTSLLRHGTVQGSSASSLLRSWGFGREEVEDMGESLSKMVLALNPHPLSSSDSD
ncbi:protein misato homolog 1 isoform X1 [Cucurbita maxima]|uniref:Protein misato homolog 1 isoform X1 n=1 Tax=Cucurbita maxima TaxID=3661 RepID=A0A6J1IRM1_CUCMA|nr:protein misato homolog 1 isoform X1 [Cucurbita maxima]